MASPAPAKSQPLHNFSLPHLKWKNHRTGRNRLAGDTSSSSPPHRSPSTPTSHAHFHPPYLQQSSPYVSRRPSPLLKQSPMRDSESESEPNGTVPIGKPSRKAPMHDSESEFVPNDAIPIGKHSRTLMRYSESESEPNGAVPIGKPSRKTAFDKSTKSSKSIDNSKVKRSNKICIRFRNNGNVKHDAAVITENHTSSPVETTVLTSTAEEDESAQKTWNLRPRRPPMSHKQSPGLPKIGSSPLPEVSEVKYNDRCNLTTSLKHKFSISLSREEIEEDIFSLTGSKPSRRPKKRPRTVQKHLDTLFPGLWLGSITADSYKVSEASPKVS